MTPLTTITGLSAEAADLLAAVGVHSINQLSIEDPARLHSRLELIAWQRGKSTKTPSPQYVEQWIAVAKMLTPEQEVELMSVEDIPEAVSEALPAQTPAPSQSQAWMPPALRATQEANGSSRPSAD